MKKILLTLSLLFCFIHSNGWSETINDLLVRDGLYYKKFTDVPFTGKVTGKNQGQLKNGIKEGLWNYYHDNGQLHEKGSYKGNTKTGEWVSYTEKGDLIYKGLFDDGKRIGDWIEKRNWSSYDKEFLFKVYSSYNKNGELNGLYKRICRNGNKREVGKFKDGKKEGQWIEYNCHNESIWEITNFKDNLLNGPYRRYHSNGNVDKGSFKNNKKDGEWFVYGYQGYERSGIFQQGKKISDLPIQ